MGVQDSQLIRAGDFNDLDLIASSLCVGCVDQTGIGFAKTLLRRAASYLLLPQRQG